MHVFKNFYEFGITTERFFALNTGKVLPSSANAENVNRASTSYVPDPFRVNSGTNYDPKVVNYPLVQDEFNYSASRDPFKVGIESTNTQHRTKSEDVLSSKPNRFAVTETSLNNNYPIRHISKDPFAVNQGKDLKSKIQKPTNSNDPLGAKLDKDDIRKERRAKFNSTVMIID